MVDVLAVASSVGRVCRAESGDGMDWLGNLTGHEDVICEDLSSRGGSTEGGDVEECAGQPG